jgi:DNA ligase-1
MLAHTYDPDKHGVAGWYASEKLDGMRALWDGGVTRGMLARDVPFANTEKDGRLVRPPVATGLWSRLGKVIHAPDSFLDRLPQVPLDGELYMGRGKFQHLMSTVRSIEPGVGWSYVQYAVFDSPAHDQFLDDAALRWLQGLPVRPHEARPFEATLTKLRELIGVQTRLYVPTQELIRDRDHLTSLLDEVCNRGGEGIMLRRPGSHWRPERSWDLLKVKKSLDGTGEVAGYVWGQGKYLGMMGAMVVKWGAVEFELCGFTDAERQLSGAEVAVPGGLVKEATSRRFPIGSSVSFRYRELTNSGVPKEARFWRRES